MTWIALRIYVVGFAVIAGVLLARERLSRPRARTGRLVNEIRPLDADSAIVLWTIDGERYVTRVGLDGQDRWRVRIPGETEYGTLLVTDSAVFVRYTRDSDEWAERIDLDGQLRWRHLIASHQGPLYELESHAEPGIENGALIEEVQIAKQTWLRDSFDVRTGWPLHEEADPDAAAPWTRFDDPGPYRCLVGDVAVVIMDEKDHQVIRATENHPPYKRVWELPLGAHHDEYNYSLIRGCGTWADRSVILLRRQDRHEVWFELVEAARGGSPVRSPHLPPLTPAIPSARDLAVLPPALTRFVPVSVADGDGRALALLDLGLGQIVWRGAMSEASIEIFADHGRWYVLQGIADVFSIDGQTGAIDAFAQARYFESALEHSSNGTIWMETRDSDALFPIDGRTLGPMGIRAHILALTARVPRATRPL